MHGTLITTNEQRDLIDKQIDKGEPASMPFAERNTAILHVLRCFELCWCEIERIRRSHGDAVAEVDLDVATDALHFCLKWINELLPQVEALISLPSTTKEEIDNCSELIETARRYAEMCDVMGILWLNKIEAIENAPGEIELKYTPEQMQHQAAQWLWRLQQIPNVASPDVAVRQLQEAVAELGSENIDHRVLTKLDHEIVRALHQNGRDLSDSLWQLPKPLPLSRFTTKEFSDFWIALRTIIGVHRYVFTGVEATHLQAAIAVLKPEEWVELIADISGLDFEKVRYMVDYLTYDYSLVKKTEDKKHKSEAMCFPFYRLGDERLAASSLVVLNSSAERNLFDLACAKEGTKYDGLKKTKEEQWSIELAQRFKKHGLLAKPQAAYPGTPGIRGGDIDLFVFGSMSKQALIVQLKWLLMNRIKGDHVKTANEAFDQARRAIAYIKANTKDAAERLAVSEDDLKGAAFLPLAVIKESNLHGFATDAEIPILNGVMFDAVIEESAGDLARLWQIIFTDKSFLPVQGRDFAARSSTVPYDGKPFAGIRFTKPQLNLPALGYKWKPFTR